MTRFAQPPPPLPPPPYQGILKPKGEDNRRGQRDKKHTTRLLTRVNGVMHPDKCLTGSMRKGSFRGAHHQYVLRGLAGAEAEIPTLAVAKTTKFLGAVYGASPAAVRGEVTGALQTEMERIDAANVGDAIKILIYQDYLVPAWKYRLAVQEELTTRRRELRALEDIATRFLKRWARLPQSATRAILYGDAGMGLASFSHMAVATQVEVLEQAAKGDEELRRAVAEQVTREDAGEDGFNPTAVAFAIWTGRSAGQAQAQSREAQAKEKKKKWARLKELQKRAKQAVAQWRAGNAGQGVRHTRQGRRRRQGQVKRAVDEETVLAGDVGQAEQWDAGNVTRAKREANRIAREEMAAGAMGLAKQGEWFRLAKMEQEDRQWGGVVRRLRDEARAWCLKAAIRVLPDATNRRLWFKKEPKLCRCGKVATDAHVLSACEIALRGGRYKWRHDGVLKALDEAIRPVAGERWQVHTDLQGQEHSQAWLAAHGVVTQRRPDMLLAKTTKDGEVEQVVIVELSCPWEAESSTSTACSESDEWAMKAKAAGKTWRNTLEKRRTAKRFKYETLLMGELPREWKAQLRTVEIGTRGLVSAETRGDMHSIFRAVGGNKDAKRRTDACLEEARRRAMLGSYLIWVHGERDDWDLAETVGRWRGGRPQISLAATDQERQKKEREEARKRGEWNNDGGDTVAEAEAETRAEAGMPEQEWQAKTRTRRRVREAAESAGGLCYFPDGSSRGGLSGWGWVAQQSGRELARGRGPVRLYGEEGWRGAQYHSNNAGELTAVIEVLEHARANAPPESTVMVAPDNLWAADVTAGACSGLVHRRLVREARAALASLEERGVSVQWGWCKGHSEHKWNEIADRLAEEGRRQATGEEEGSTGPKEAKRTRATRTRVLRVEQVVDARRVREAMDDAETAAEARRWAACMVPRGDGTAAVETHYVRNNPFARRNAEGVSLQFCSKNLRQKIAGEIYTEIDIKGSHPTMLRAQLSRVGYRLPLLDRWVDDREACVAEIQLECQKAGGTPTQGEVKGLFLALVNGAGLGKWCHEKWGMKRPPAVLWRFAEGLRTVRANAEQWFPGVWSHAKKAENDWRRRTQAVFFAMTALEDEVLEAMRVRLPERGMRCDALTGDGLLVRPLGTGAPHMERTLRALEAGVFAETGVKVTLGAKRLDGRPAAAWSGCPEQAAPPRQGGQQPQIGHGRHP